MSDLILKVTDQSFDKDVLNNAHPVLVDFWAEWCGPCKMLAPVLDEVAEHFKGTVVVAKVNVDQNSDAPAKYGIRGIPSMLLFKGGKVVATKVGMQNKNQLVEFINSHLK